MTKPSNAGHDDLGPPPRVTIHPPLSPVSRARDRNSHTVRLESNGRHLQIDLMAGGRITEFSLRGENLLTGSSVHPVFYGSTAWPAPESDWGQPPPESFDRIPFVPLEATATHLSCASTRESRVAAGTKGFQIEKSFRAEPERGTFLNSYALRNSDPEKSFALAAWEVTRVLPGGITFFPYERNVREPADFSFEVESGVAWYDHRSMAYASGSKLWASGREGWLAHVIGNLLFIKEFQELRADELAPGEGDVELYSSGLAETPGSYVELEVLGPYRLLAPNEVATLVVRWHLVDLAHLGATSSFPSREDLVCLVRAHLKSFGGL